MIDILGYVAGILVVISILPQAIQTWRTKLVRDLSLWRYVIYVVGLVLWIVYAASIENGPVAVMNSIGLLLALSLLYCKIRYSVKSTIPSDRAFTEFHVPNFQPIKEFYLSLGFEIARDDDPEYLVLKKGESVLAFYCGSEKVYEHSYFKQFSKDTPRGYAIEIVVPVDDIDEFYKMFLEKIGSESVVKELEERFWGKRDFRVVDPFGYYLRFTGF